VPPLADEVRLTVPPRHIGPSLPIVVVGTELTVTDVVYTVPELQPVPVLLTVSEYTLVPVAVGVPVGLATEDDDKPVPLHAYRIVPVPPLADEVRFTFPPRHIGPSLPIVVVGTELTITDVVYTVPELQPAPVLLTESEYTLVPVADGVPVGLAADDEDKPVPLHAYKIVPVPPLADEVRFTFPPRHIGPSLPIVVVGTEFTDTDVVYTVPELQPDPVLLTVSEYTFAPVAVGVPVGLATDDEDKPVPLHA